MLLFAALLAINVRIIDSASTIPENITLTFISPTSVKVSWETSPIINHQNIRGRNPEKYDIIVKPSKVNKLVHNVTGNDKSVVLGNLEPDTQYTLTVTAVYNKNTKFKSKPITFKTQARESSIMVTQGSMLPNEYGPILLHNSNYSNSNDTNNERKLPTIRGVEIGIVLLVLVVWAGAIALFFNRWGKIRMLLPYQPAYKSEQLKVPGTGVCTGQCNGQHSHQQQMHPPWPEDSVVAIENRCSRARINSAIFVSSEGRGFDSIEFIRRYGSQSVLCRKAKSAENISDDKKPPFRQHIFDVIQQARHHDARRKSAIGMVGSAISTRKLFSKDWSCDEHQSPPIELQECTIDEADGAETVDNNSIDKQHSLQLPSSPILSQPQFTLLPFPQPSTSNQQQQQQYQRPPRLGQLPALSVSGPSPPHEKEQLL